MSGPEGRSTHKEGRPSIKSPVNYGDFLESPPPVPWEADARTWDFTYVGPQAFDLLGFPVEDWYGPSFWTRQIHPDDRLSAITTRTRLSAEGGSCEFTYRMVRADEEVIWVNDIVAVEMMGHSGSRMLRGFLIDITERMALETELSESENLLRRILHEAPDALLRVHTDGTILQGNRQAEELFGLSHDELVGSHIERVLPEGLSGKHAGYRKAFDQGRLPRSMGAGRETVALTADGSETPVRLTLSPIEHGGGIQILAHVRDLGDRKRIEAELRESEKQLRLMANSLPALIAVIDENQRYRWVNDKYATWFDLDRTQIVNRLVEEVVGEDVYRGIRSRVEAALRGEHVHFTTDLPLPGGSPRPVDVSYVPRFDERGVVSGLFEIIIDITAQVNAQDADRLQREALAHVSRVAAMGELTKSLAHELNQPLSAIVANAQAASRFLTVTTPDLGEIDDALGDIAGDAKRAGEVIRHMRDLLRERDILPATSGEEDDRQA